MVTTILLQLFLSTTIEPQTIKSNTMLKGKNILGDISFLEVTVLGKGSDFFANYRSKNGRSWEEDKNLSETEDAMEYFSLETGRFRSECFIGDKSQGIDGVFEMKTGNNQMAR